MKIEAPDLAKFLFSCLKNYRPSYMCDIGNKHTSSYLRWRFTSRM